MTHRIHRAWWVAAVTFCVLIASAAFRSSFGVMVVPFEDEFGWSRAATSLAVSVNLVFYGVTAPFATALMERFGVRRIVAGAMALLALGTGLTVFMTQSWQLTVLWGVFVGLATGSTALVLGALIANRWFAHHRGLVLGILGTAFATGQLLFLPRDLPHHRAERVALGLPRHRRAEPADDPPGPARHPGPTLGRRAAALRRDRASRRSRS